MAARAGGAYYAEKGREALNQRKEESLRGLTDKRIRRRSVKLSKGSRGRRKWGITLKEW